MKNDKITPWHTVPLPLPFGKLIYKLQILILVNAPLQHPPPHSLPPPTILPSYGAFTFEIQ